MVMGLLVVNVNIFLLLGEAPDYSNIVVLESPVQGQSVYVKNGGTHALLNRHIPAFWQPQNWNSSIQYRSTHYYGVDLILVNEDGRPSDVWWPRNQFDYVGYNTFIHAPCAGTVISVEDDRNDQLELNSGLGQIVLECGSFEVQLGHLLSRSLVLRKGDRVATGQVIGTLGAASSGEPPYLHLQVQRREVQTNGSVRVIPVQLSIGDKFLARGDMAP